MKGKSYILLLLSCLMGLAAYSQNIEFVENKGQWDSSVRFMGQVSNGAFFIHKDGFTVLQHNSDDLNLLHEFSHEHTVNGKPYNPHQPLTLRSHAYRVHFVNANPATVLVPDKALFNYNNYFIGNDPSKWATNCKVYQAVTVKDVYPNIDIRYYSDNGTLKYDLVVKPGGRVSDIALKYDGADGLEIRNKELVISTTVGKLKELSPYTYQYKTMGKEAVGAKYLLKDKTVRFNIKDYDNNQPLIIDPTLVFCSFTGSTADNWGFTATYGPDGSMYGGGIVMAQGFPVSNGAFQQTYGGGNSVGFGAVDIGIIKLSPDGSNREYATYIGGSGNENPQSLIVDPQGNLIMAGRTESTNYPLTAPLIGTGGGFDIVITKLNATGTALIGSRKIGGTGNDGANITNYGGNDAISLLRNYGDEARSEVNLDGGGNIYLASCTQSVATGGSGGFPVVGGFQSNNAGGVHSQDGVVLKFNPNLTNLLFSTYLGGAGDDAAYVLSLHPQTNQIYVAGGTASMDFPGRAGPIGASSHGNIDGFVSIISNDGSTLVSSAYVGTAADDQVYGIQFDRLGFPYIMGQTTGSWPIINVPWSQANGKQFIAKLQPDLSNYVYSTVFGKGEANPDISPVAFLVDRCENVYVSGWGGKFSGLRFPNAGVFGMSVTPDAIKTTADRDPDGVGQDFYFFVLKRDATAQLYGSFFGQNGGLVDHVDGGTSRFDRNGVIYQAICANCGRNVPFPTTPGVWAPTNGSNNCNLAMVKIAFNLAGVQSGVQSSINGVVRDTSGCVPLTVQFRDTVQLGTSYEWNFGDGSPTITTVGPDTAHTYTAVGTYRVMLVAIDPNSCNVRDTSYLNIKVGDLRAQLDFNPVKLNPCDQFKYRFDNLSVAPPAAPFGAKSFQWDFGDGSPRVTAGTESVFHDYASPGTYTIKLFIQDTAYCNYPDSLPKQIRVAALVKANFETPPNGCAPYTASFINTSDGGSQFTWNFGDGTSSNEVNPQHLYATPGTYTVSLVAIDSATCNIIDDTSFTITVYGIPTADFTAAPQPPVENTPISFTNLSSTDAVRFKWVFGDGDSLITTSRAIVQHEYNSTGTFQACLTAINPAGCSNTICKTVTTLIVPALDVPNAFTPLSEDVNSRVFVRGFGIAKMKFIIWSRWGEKVFESNDKRIGWDGHYKGKLLPMDVYAYTLEAEFTDGTRTTKKGDITLIR